MLAARESEPVLARVTRWVGRVRANRIVIAVDTVEGVQGWAETGRSRDGDLLGEVLAERPAHVWVLRGNERAIRFYRRHDFEFDGAEMVDEIGLVDLRMRRG